MDEKKEMELRIFPYNEIRESASEILNDFCTKGFIAIGEVPGFIEAYERFLSTAQEFTALPTKVQAECTPELSFARGWSRGIEVFDGKKDTYKGSYYACIPDDSSNIWPNQLPLFRKYFVEVSNHIARVGKEILPLVGMQEETTCVTRMLHYGAISENEDDGNPYWCGLHRDHGLFTGLCPEVYFREGKRSPKPERSGLHILDAEISLKGVMMFQIGESLEVYTNGSVRATEHYVQKAFGGYERYTMASFFQASDDLKLSCTNPDVIDKYSDRYSSNMTFKTWNDRSLAKYNL